MQGVHVVDHPLVQHKLTLMRDRTTSTAGFRTLLREFGGFGFGNLEIVKDCIHETAQGERLLVLHGDEFDSVVKCSAGAFFRHEGSWAVYRVVNGRARLTQVELGHSSERETEI